MPDAFFLPLGAGRYAATELTRGPWDRGAQHGGPPSALLGRELERVAPRGDARVVRVTVELLGPVPIAEMTVQACLVRPGRSVELLEGVLSAGGREVLRARAWRIRAAPGVVPVTAAQQPADPAPDTLPPAEFFEGAADIGYHTGMDWRFASGSSRAVGPALAWARLRVPLVAGEEPSPLQRVLAAADSGNGISGELPYGEWLFVNPDLTVALHRLPVGEWVGLDAVTTLDPDGIGLARLVLRDTSGPVGIGLQTLFVAPRPTVSSA